MKFSLKPIVFSLILVAAGIACVEGFLQVLAYAMDTPPTVPDTRLGHRPNPAHAEHDRRGFRNRKAPDTVAIVALGDSQTYGTGVAPAQAWPQQLEKLTGKTAYNMAYGGYGPPHSLILWDEAASMQPQVVVEAMYAGNDLFDAFNLVYNRKQLPGLASGDAQVRAAIQAAERRETIVSRVSRLYDMGTAPGGGAGAAPPMTVGVFLNRHSEIYRALVTARHALARRIRHDAINREEDWRNARIFAAERPAFCEVLDTGRFRTIFTSDYRLAAVDQDDPRMREGLEISLRAIGEMQRRAVAANRRYVVLMIPTKESVFRAVVANPSPAFARLTENEERVWRVAKDFFDRNGIAHVDALPALQARLAAGVQPYPVSHDGHPNSEGHAAIAATMADWLGKSDQSRSKAVR